MFAQGKEKEQWDARNEPSEMGQSPSKKLLNEISMRDRSVLREEMTRVAGGIDTAVDVSCSSS